MYLCMYVLILYIMRMFIHIHIIFILRSVAFMKQLLNILLSEENVFVDSKVLKNVPQWHATNAKLPILLMFQLK